MMMVNGVLRLGLWVVAVGALCVSPFFLCNTVAAQGGHPLQRLPAPILTQATTAPLLDVARFRNRLVAVGIRGLILTSDDEGLTWEQRDCPTDITLTALVYAGSGKGFVVGHEESLLETDDNGATWRLVRTNPSGVPLLRIRFVGALTAYALGGHGVIYRTSDGGNSWNRTTVTAEDGFDPHLFDIVRLEDRRLVLGGEGGRLFRSSDGGYHWRELQSPYKGSFFGLVKLGSQQLLAYGMLGHAFVSPDGGDSWEEIVTGTKESFFASDIRRGHVYLAGAGGVIAGAERNDPRVFTVHVLADRPTISGFMPTSNGWIFALDNGLRQFKLSVSSGQ